MNCVCEQILVVVAISNMRDIMTDEKKGYIRTLIGYMLVDPKGTYVGRDRCAWLARAPSSEREMC